MKPGTIVECIDDRGFLIPEPPGAAPVKGGLYTIRDIDMFGGVKACSLVGFDPDGYYLICRFKVPAKLNQKLMIKVKKSPTADTRTCDYKNVDKGTLMESSRVHIGDVVKAIAFFQSYLTEAAGEHDFDKLTDIDHFHADFLTGFRTTSWWDYHRRMHRHHLNYGDGIPLDVNLLDVLEHIADCVMAGMARSGSVYELKLPNELLQKAFQNTVELLKKQVEVDPT